MKKKAKRYAIIGLDGSGKSTNIEKIINDEKYKDYKHLWVRWGVLFLKPFYLILTKEKNKTSNPITTREQYNQKHKKKNHVKSNFFNCFIFKSNIVKYLWILLVLIDYQFQFYKHSISLIIKKENIIFDRYFIDLFVDQGINLGYTPKTISKLVNRHQFLFPKINKYIYIKVPPEICYSRKEDVPNMEYLTKRYEIYEELSKNKNWITINGEESLDQVYLNITKEIN